MVARAGEGSENVAPRLTFEIGDIVSFPPDGHVMVLTKEGFKPYA